MNIKIRLDELGHTDNMPGIVLSKSRHRENRLEVLKRKGISGFKGYKNITIEDLYNAVGIVYRDDPLQKQVLVRIMMEFMF